jgi:hypothetical protein
MKKVWKVTTALNEQENKDFMTSMSEEDHTLVSGLELDLSVDVLENEKITSFVVCNELNLEKLKSLLMKHNVEFKVDDTTEFFVNEEVKVEDLSDEYIYEKLGI